MIPLIEEHFHTIVLAWIALAPIVFVVLFFIDAPYGRHGDWLKGPMVPGRVGWLIMEAPSAILMAVFFLLGTHTHDPAAWCFLALWELHYVHRAFIFPLRMRGAPRPMPIPTALGGLSFNFINASLVGWYLFTRAPIEPVSFLREPHFLAGVAVFLAGFVINFHADTVLLNLRKPGESGYKIPYGGMYRFITCPNYFGEILEWCGFALATWCLPALAFAIWTAANLVPRARTNHRWYLQRFPDYPPERTAILPFVV